MTRQPRRNDAVRAWNTTHQVGTRVRYRDRSGELREGSTQTGAWLRLGVPSVAVKGYPWAIPLTDIEIVQIVEEVTA